jgi:hypothetical protein
MRTTSFHPSRCHRSGSYPGVLGGMRWEGSDAETPGLDGVSAPFGSVL